jgi:predicted Zn-dependent protease
MSAPHADDGAPKRLIARAPAVGASQGAAERGVLTRAEAQALVERTLRHSTADAARVSVQGGRETNLRFADNQISTSGATTNTTVRVQSVFGKRRAAVVTNDRSDEGLRAAVRQSEALARLAPEDPEYPASSGRSSTPRCRRGSTRRPRCRPRTGRAPR